MGGAITGEPSAVVRGVTLGLPAVLLAGVGYAWAAVIWTILVLSVESYLASISLQPAVSTSIALSALGTGLAHAAGWPAFYFPVPLAMVGAWVASPRRLASFGPREGNAGYLLAPLGGLVLWISQPVWENAVLGLASALLVAWVVARFWDVRDSIPAQLDKDGGVFVDGVRIGTAENPPADAPEQERPVLAWPTQSSAEGYRKAAEARFRVRLVLSLSGRPPTEHSIAKAGNDWARLLVCLMALRLVDDALSWNSIMRHIPW